MGCGSHSRYLEKVKGNKCTVTEFTLAGPAGSEENPKRGAGWFQVLLKYIY